MTRQELWLSRRIRLWPSREAAQEINSSTSLYSFLCFLLPFVQIQKQPEDPKFSSLLVLEGSLGATELGGEGWEWI